MGFEPVAHAVAGAVAGTIAARNLQARPQFSSNNGRALKTTNTQITSREVWHARRIGHVAIWPFNAAGKLDSNSLNNTRTPISQVLGACCPPLPPSIITLG